MVIRCEVTYMPGLSWYFSKPSEIGNRIPRYIRNIELAFETKHKIETCGSFRGPYCPPLCELIEPGHKNAISSPLRKFNSVSPITDTREEIRSSWFPVY